MPKKKAETSKKTKPNPTYGMDFGEIMERIVRVKPKKKTTSTTKK